MENGRTLHYTPPPSLPPFPEAAQPEPDDSVVSDDSTEVDDSVAADDPFTENAVNLPNFLPNLNLDESNPDGLPDQTVNQIELFFSSRFCRVNVCQCHTTVTADDLEGPTRGILCLQSFLDTQLPTQVQSAKLLLCIPKTFHVMWSKQVFVNGPNATSMKEDGDALVLGPDSRIHFRGTAKRREKFISDLRIALQKLRIHVSQDKSARKKAIKAYKKERKDKGKVTKNHISIPCEFAHVTQLTHRHLSPDAPSVNGQTASSPDSAFSTGSLYA